MLDNNALWKQRYRSPTLKSVVLASANPARGLLVSNHQSSAFELYAWEVEVNLSRPLTRREGGTSQGWISPDGAFVYYLEDDHGNELGHLVRVPFESGEPYDLTPNLPSYTLRGFSFSGDGRKLAFNAVNPEGFSLFVTNAQGNPQLVNQSKLEAWGALLSQDGGLVAQVSTSKADGQRNYSLVVYEPSSKTLVGEAWDGPQTSLESVAFSPISGDTRLLATSNKSGFKKPLIWNPVSGEREDLEINLEGEVFPLEWSADTQTILLCQINWAEQRLFSYRLASRELKRLEHQPGTYYTPWWVPGDQQAPFFAPSGQIWTLKEDSVHPPQLVELRADTGKETKAILTVGELYPSRALRSVGFASSDGQKIQGWLGVPEGEGPFPTILHIHGGPHFSMDDIFLPGVQAWLDHGLAYLSVNYRGSTTFGREFKEKIWGDIGHWELEDMVAARGWLVDQGIADPSAIFLAGGSYGGYLTLWGLGKRPELWVGGVAMVAIGDWAMSYEDSNDALKAFAKGLFGGTPAEVPERYRKSSPITYAEHVQAPLQIIQGRTDTRTPARQLQAYEARMRELGKELEVIWFDSGHVATDTEQLIQFTEHRLRFIYKVLNRK